MRTAKPKPNADRSFQLLGLAWAGEETSILQKLASALLVEQRADGGWGQLPTMTSDAYATGKSLTAFSESIAVAATDAAYQRGVEYLRSTQLENGSGTFEAGKVAFDA